VPDRKPSREDVAKLIREEDEASGPSNTLWDDDLETVLLTPWGPPQRRTRVVFIDSTPHVIEEGSNGTRPPQVD
jgi:hypothetical protein